MSLKRLAPPRRWAALLALGLVGTAAYAAVPRTPTTGADAFVGLLGVALVASVCGWRRTWGSERSSWGWASLALAAAAAGGIVWIAGPLAKVGSLHTVASGCFLLSCGLLSVAAWTLVQARELEYDRSAFLESGILTAAAGVVAWDALIEPYVGDAALSTPLKLVHIAQPLGYVLALGFVLRLLLSRQARDRPTNVFAFGATVLLLTELVFCRQDLATSFRPGAQIDAIWLLSFLLVGFASSWSSTPVVAHAPRRQAHGRVRLGTVLLAVFVPELILVQGLAGHGSIGLNTQTVATCTSILVIALAAAALLHLLGRARQAELLRGEVRLSALIMHSADAIFLVDEACRIGFASPSAEALWGRKAKALVGTSILDAFVEEHRGAFARQLENLATTAPGTTLPVEGRIVAAGGQVRVLEGICRNLLDDDNVRATVVTLRDTTDRRELEQQLERRAFHDDLTGLANRALFADRLSHALKRNARDEKEQIAVLFLDLDDFKAVNDGMGHGAGDELIRGAAERIRASVRPGDTVARLGGDEFAVLLEDATSLEHAVALAERLLEVLQLPIDVIGVGLAIRASVGVTFGTSESTAESLLRDADIAMYSAKSQGKGRVAVFDARLRDVAVRRLELKVELPAALKASQFRVVYQPIKRISDEGLSGFEALVRWHHPERGLIPPGEFIPAAEETGMIVELGRWVLARACEQASFWNSRSIEPLGISVNVSGLQFHQPGFVEDVVNTLETTRLSPGLLTLELTESVLVKHQSVESILSELRQIGVGIAIDDFGTGYSSLSYLQQFPATSIKIDRGFVAALADRGEVGLVRSIISISEALGLATIAEGVETTEQLEVLRSLGCDLAQGFLLGRPQTAGEIDGMMEIERMARTERRGHAQFVAHVEA
jgi:diguanylate cyclase (GGDEF)-like protein/PAS domain S-box-containing protein